VLSVLLSRTFIVTCTEWLVYRCWALKNYPDYSGIVSLKSANWFVDYSSISFSVDIFLATVVFLAGSFVFVFLDLVTSAI
jgi:hypothetical protein